MEIRAGLRRALWWSHRLVLVLFAAVAVHAIYLGFSDAAGRAHFFNVLGHIGFGFVLAAVVAAYGAFHMAEAWGRGSAGSITRGILALLALVACAGSGVWLTYAGAVAGTRWLLWTHIVGGAAAIFVYAYHRSHGQARETIPLWRRPAVALAASVVLVGLYAAGTLLQGAHKRARGPEWTMPPTVLGVAVGDPKSPFFASSVTLAGNRPIPTDAFLRLDAPYCGNSGCHPDVTDQWRSSVHRRSAFNDPYFRRNVEYNESRGSPRIITRFCAGCHMPGALVNGLIPEKGPLDDKNPLIADVGISCIACHSMTKLHHVKGNSSYELENPDHYPFAGSENGALAEVNRILIESKPGPHKATFLKPIHLQPEFCGTCHRVGIPSAANGYGWQRGFDEYGSWQSSAASGHSARAFYHPPSAKRCQDCHMPLVASKDAGAVDGKVHDHTFATANTAVPLFHKDDAQVARVKAFLSDKRISLDVVAVVAETPTGERALGPLRDGDPVRRGQSVRLEIAVRNRGLGHQFTGGTRDAHEPWIDLTVRDAEGRVLLRSGALDEKGFRDPNSHVYEAYMIDRGGARVSRRNAALDYIAMVYGRIIEAGQVDVVRYDLRVPEDAVGPLSVDVALNYRKWNQWYYQWTFGGEVDPRDAGANVTLLYDPRRWVIRDVDIPPLPVIEMARASLKLDVVDRETPSPDRREPGDRDRWYDYGVGLCAMRDLDRAEAVFKRVVEMDPAFADGYVGLGRTLVMLDRPEEARKALQRAQALDPGCAPADFFAAAAEKGAGRYASALEILERLATRVPRDRFVHLEIGQIHYLQGDFARAAGAFRRALDIEPEEYVAHYYLAFCERAMGREEAAKKHEALAAEYRFHPEAPRTWLVGPSPYRREAPWDMLEGLPFHTHGDVTQR